MTTKPIVTGSNREELRERPPPEASPQTSQPKVLHPLGAAQLSDMYGKGFDLLKRMGFAGAGCGLRSDSLQAPPRAHDQGRSRRGVQGASEVEDQPVILEAPMVVDAEEQLPDKQAVIVIKVHRRARAGRNAPRAHPSGCCGGGRRCRGRRRR